MGNFVLYCIPNSVYIPKLYEQIPRELDSFAEPCSFLFNTLGFSGLQHSLFLSIIDTQITDSHPCSLPASSRPSAYSAWRMGVNNDYDGLEKKQASTLTKEERQGVYVLCGEASKQNRTRMPVFADCQCPWSLTVLHSGSVHAGA